MDIRKHLIASLLAAALPAQIQDDADIAIDPFGKGSHGLRMAHTDDGRIVGAWVIHDAGVTPGSDELVVGVSSDGGSSWKLLWDGRSNVSHTNRIADLSIAVTPVRGRGAPADPWVYVAAEFVEHDWRMSSPQRRYIQCIDGPLERPWGGLRLRGVHVHGQFTHQANVSAFMPSTRPSIALPLYEEQGQVRHMVVIAYRWWDAPSAGLYLGTPYAGDRGRIAHGKQVYSERLSQDGAYPSIAADPDGRTFFVAHELASDVLSVELDVQQFRIGRPAVLATESVGTKLQRPHIAVSGSVAALTALERNWNNDGSQPLRWYRKRRSAPWNLEGHLHGSAFSPAPIVFGEARIFACAHCVIDPGSRSRVAALVAFTARTSTTFPTVQATRVGDTPSLDGLPSLALTQLADACAYGYGDTDLWWFGGSIPEVLVEPAR